MDQKLVVIVTPKASTAGTLRTLLDGMGYRHSVLQNLTTSEALQTEGVPDLLIIDINVYELLPASILRKICFDLNYPPVMVLGNDDLFDRALARDIRADDYLRQPLCPAEARVRVTKALAWRNSPDRSEDPAATCAHFASWSFDPGRLELMSNDGSIVRLTSAEARVLLHLLKASRRIVPRDSLQSNESWNGESAYARSVDILVSRIRKKIEPHASLITTVYGVGYMLDCEVSWRPKDCI